MKHVYKDDSIIKTIPNYVMIITKLIVVYKSLYKLSSNYTQIVA